MKHNLVQSVVGDQILYVLLIISPYNIIHCFKAKSDEVHKVWGEKRREGTLFLVKRTIFIKLKNAKCILILYYNKQISIKINWFEQPIYNALTSFNNKNEYTFTYPQNKANSLNVKFKCIYY